jgi:uncharacterized protein (TIGR02145 family)
MNSENEAIKYCPFCKNQVKKSLDDIRSDINKFLSPYFDLYGADLITDILDDEIIQRKPAMPAVHIERGLFEDPRDGELYETVIIDGREWFAENLRFHCRNSVVLDDNNVYLDCFGLLYTYHDAKKYIPEGWRLPTTEDWDSLINFADEITCNSTRSLMHKDGWKGTDGVYPIDNFGFGIYAAGYVDILGESVYVAESEDSEVTCFWADSSTDCDSEGHHAVNSLSLSKHGWEKNYRAPDYKFSVRLVRDQQP